MKKMCVAVLVMAGVCGRAMAEEGNVFVQTNLVANREGFGAAIIDPNMVDAWGIALRPPGAGGHIWISNAFTGTSSEYIGDVNGQALHQDGLKIVPVETAGFADRGTAFVTGQVYNAASDLPGQPVEFAVSGPAHDLTTGADLGVVTGAAKFVFVTEDGTINAWRSGTTQSMDTALVMIDYSKTGRFPAYDAANPVFTGVAMTTHGATVSAGGTATANNFLFAADFRNNHINVFNNQWQDLTTSFSFETPADIAAAGEDPSLHLHAYNIQDLDGHLFVTYASFDPNGDEGFEQLDGPGRGRVVEYNEDGTLVREFADGGHLNSPWGMAIAPAGFGKFGGDLLVANFGDGTISAFDLGSGAFVGNLEDAAGAPISIDGIWGLTFGNGVSLGDAGALYFTAGPNGEEDGLFGRVNAVPGVGSLSLLGVGVVGVVGRRRR
jgi:uncharacterized protein (TIGR03118 family)